MDKQSLKQEVYHYWNQASCGTEVAHNKKFSKEYFDEIEAYRYAIESEIFSFAQFTRYRNKKVLEVGIGAGTDFVQWVRAGAQAYGVDLTQEAVENTQTRLMLENIYAQELRVADAENLPYEDAQFDLVYSWGVIHHSPDTIKCLEEIIRVTKSSGTIKLMLYNRRSLFALYRYMLAGLLKGKPFQSIASVLYHHQESKGTKAYTFKEIKKIMSNYSIQIISLQAPVTKHDLLFYKAKPFQWLAYLAACALGWNRSGWYMMIELKKN